MRRWTEDDLAYMRDHYNTDGASAVAAALGKTASQVHSRARTDTWLPLLHDEIRDYGSTTPRTLLTPADYPWPSWLKITGKHYTSKEVTFGRVGNSGAHTTRKRWDDPESLWGAKRFRGEA